MTCCMCGSGWFVSYCPLCDHNFCVSCRTSYFERGLAAMKQLLLKVPPKFCECEEGRDETSRANHPGPDLQA